MKKILSLSLFGLAAAVAAAQGAASALKPKPGQTSTTCYFNLGPKAGGTENLLGRIPPTAIGKPCADDKGSSGITVFDKKDEEAEEAEEEAKQAKAVTTRHKGESSDVCRFDKGPRKGLTENFRGKLQPRPVGSPCTDGLGSTGLVVIE